MPADKEKAMAVTIKSILKKNTWTGEEVGRALILNLIYTWKEQQAGHGRLRSLFSDGQFNMMVDSLQGLDIDIYNNYVGLNNWIITNKTQANGYYLQAEAGIKKLFGILTTATAGENVYKYIEKIPVIVTETQYERLTAEGRERAFKSWADVDLFSLLWDAIEYYSSELDANPDTKNPLQTIKKKYESAPVTSKLFISAYNELMENGYWQLEDGTRSDKVTGLEWLIASLKPEYRERVQGLLQGNDDEQESSFVSEEMQELMRILAEGMYKEDTAEAELTQQGRTDHDIEAKLEEIGSEYLQPKKWIASEKAEGLTKWELIYNCSSPMRYYCTEADKKEKLAITKEFVADFAELTKALLADIKKKTGKDVTKLKPEQWQGTCWKIKELYDKDIYGYKDIVDSTTNAFDGDERASFAGVAVIKEAGSAMRKSPDGDYIAPEITNPLTGTAIGLEQYLESNPAHEKNIKNLEECIDNIEQGYRCVLIYDVACEMIAKYTKLKEFVIFKQGADQIAEEIKALNAFVPMLYLSISETNYSDKENQRQKLAVLREHFKPIDTSRLGIDQVDYDRAWKLLNKDYMDVFSRNTGIFFRTLGGWEE